MKNKVLSFIKQKAAEIICKFTPYVHLHGKLLSRAVWLVPTRHAVECVAGRQEKDLMGIVPNVQQRYSLGLKVYFELIVACLIPMLMR